MACPFFLPHERRDDLLWPHPARLPLGAGFGGLCAAPGQDQASPSDALLTDFCNLGYARSCPRLPVERSADCVRYAVQLDAGARIVIAWVRERDHAPGDHGLAEYDCAAHAFAAPHPDRCLQRQMECYLESYLRRRPQAAAQRA